MRTVLSHGRGGGGVRPGYAPNPAPKQGARPPAPGPRIARSRPGVHLALDATGADLAGFACAGLWGRNAFGPMGTVDEKQGRGIGGVLLLRCLLDLRDCGEKDAVISWIGPERFYERRCAAETTLRYVALRKELRPGAPADGSPTDDESFDSRCPQSDASA